jgi:hypothetical protein
VVSIVNEVDDIVHDGDAMRTGIRRLVSPGTEKRTLAVEDDDRVVASVEHVDVVMRVGRDSPDIPM